MTFIIRASDTVVSSPVGTQHLQWGIPGSVWGSGLASVGTRVRGTAARMAEIREGSCLRPALDCFAKRKDKESASEGKDHL